VAEPRMWDPNGPIEPAEHAAVILEVCGGDLDEARAVCISNMLGDCWRSGYWELVLNGLFSGGTA
jgi:hypothetical protein